MQARLLTEEQVYIQFYFGVITSVIGSLAAVTVVWLFVHDRLFPSCRGLWCRAKVWYTRSRSLPAHELPTLPTTREPSLLSPPAVHSSSSRQLPDCSPPPTTATLYAHRSSVVSDDLSTPAAIQCPPAPPQTPETLPLRLSTESLRIPAPSSPLGVSGPAPNLAPT